MADEIVLPNSGVAINADTGVGMPTAQDSSLLAQMLMMSGAADPETAAALSQQNNQYMAAVKDSTDAQINAATTSNQQYQGVVANARNALMSNAEQQAIIAKRQIELSNQAAEASAVVTENVNTARNNTMLQVGGVQALDALGMKLQQAMALNEQKQLEAQQAVKSSNPMVEGLLSAFGIRSQAQAAVEDADIAQENYARTVRQRNDLVTAMSGADSLVTQLGTALNGATQKAALDGIAIKAASDAATLEKQALSNDAQSMIQLTNLEVGAIHQNFSALNTIHQAERQQLAAEHQMITQEIRLSGVTKSRKLDYTKNMAANIGRVSPELQAKYLEAASKGDKDAMQDAYQDASDVLQAGALLGLTPQDKKSWTDNYATINRVAENKKAGKPDSEILMDFKNPLLTSRFMSSNPQLYSGSAAVYNPDSISAMQNLIGGVVSHTTNGAKGKPLTPQEAAQVNTGVLGAIEKEAANPFNSRNKVIRMDAASLLAAAQTSPDSPVAKSPVTQFLVNRYKENPKAVITLDDYRDYIIHSTMASGNVTSFNKQAVTDVIRHMNALYSDVVNRSGVRVYGADYNIVPKSISLYGVKPGISGRFEKPVRLSVDNPDALSRVFKNASGIFSIELDELGDLSKTPINNLLYEEGDK